MDIYFYRTVDDYGWLSNFYRSPVEIDGIIYPTIEHYFQSMKMVHASDRELVRTSSTPSLAAKEGRSRPMRPDWDQIKIQVMERALMAKFTQHPRLKDLLLATGDAILIEHTDKDRFWADGGDGRGQNQLGLALMRVRDRLRNE